MEYLIGVLMGAVVAALGFYVGYDRERSFASIILIVVAFYYVLFAVMGGSESALYMEGLFACGFLLLSVFGFRKHFWLLPAGIASHGVFDFFHRYLIDNPGVPIWWPGFCMTIDVFLGAWLGWLSLRRAPLLLPGTSIQ